jgi:signal transduction histidine kinase
MQWLPDVVTTQGSLALPLCGGTAWRLAAAFVAGDGSRPNRSLLADALARDPALALWTISKAHARESAPLRTVDVLAAWLASNAIDQWNGANETAARAAPGVEIVERWASLAARSIGTARRAGQIARHGGTDEGAAYLLGLVHLAPEWLAAGNPSEPGPLPAWLRDDLNLGAVLSGEPATAADCVAAALRGEMPPDGESYEAPVAAVRDDWLRDSPTGLLSNLAAKLRRLRELEENFLQTLETEKLDSLKELAYGAGHEINNPLANISARAQTLLRDERDPERKRMLASINSQAFRAHEMIADMMLFARPPRAKAEPFDVARLVRGLYDELGQQAAAQQTQLVLRAPLEPLPIVADQTQIAVALRSLCTNALEALVSGGRVDIALDKPSPGDESVRITIADNGPGISAEARRHLFDPFYSGREAGRGLGLGLSKCWRIVTMHRGRVEVDSAEGRGSVFTVTLPACNGR